MRVHRVLPVDADAPEPDEPPGLGLMLVDRIADQWSVVEGQDHVPAWFPVAIPRQSAA